MKRSLPVAVLFLAIASAADAADVPEIPPEKRKGVIDALLAKKPKEVDIVTAKIKALESAVIDSKKKLDIPKDPEAAPNFPSKKVRDEYEKFLDTEMRKAKDRLKNFTDRISTFYTAPGMGEVGNFIVYDGHFRKVSRVISKSEAVVEFSVPGPRGVPPVRYKILFSGIDASKLVDDGGIDLKEIYYVAGPAKVGDTTIMQHVPLVFTTEERATLGLPLPKIDKK